jgi:hypothetical protein
MDQLGSAPNAALVASLLLLVSMLWLRRRQAHSPRQRTEDALDTVQAWPAQLVRAMTPLQRRAYDLLRQALPEHAILVQTPLAQFMRVPTRHSYVEWYRRAGKLRATLLVCDRHSSVVAAIQLRLSNENAREQSRRARLERVLGAVGVTMLVWTESDMPSLAQVRRSFVPLLAEQARSAPAAEPDGFESGDMSGTPEAMGVESTDFAGLVTLPAPLDERGSTGRGPRNPRPA